MTLIMECGYAALHGESTNSIFSCRCSLLHQEIGFFLGIGGRSSGGETDFCDATTGQRATSVYSSTSGALSVASGRLSYALGLTGPSLSLDTACSSSLVALHLVVCSFSLSKCQRAATAGIGLLTAGVTHAFSAARMLSALGRCHTFDRSADGYCRGEGCCTHVLNSVDSYGRGSLKHSTLTSIENSDVQ